MLKLPRLSIKYIFAEQASTSVELSMKHIHTGNSLNNNGTFNFHNRAGCHFNKIAVHLTVVRCTSGDGISIWVGQGMHGWSREGMKLKRKKKRIPFFRFFLSLHLTAHIFIVFLFARLDQIRRIFRLDSSMNKHISGIYDNGTQSC